MDFSQERILQKFEYRKEDGAVIRKRNGKVVSAKDRDGYIIIADHQNGKTDYMKAARLVWTMFYGAIPEGMVMDHIDGNRSNNRLDNLRPVNYRQNTVNSLRDKSKDTSKYKGVWKDKRGRFRATIQKDGKTLFLGWYEHEEVAAYAYNLKAQELFGDFAKKNPVPPCRRDKLHKTVAHLCLEIGEPYE